ncbi:MAG: hypothetical protein NTW87_18740, partial [Planctomycetota bacterium]|nr:hypothetical protein [Planctomycetota bacterium]
ALMCCDLAGMPAADLPFVWLVLAALAHGAWTFAGPRDEVHTQGALAADMVALTGLGYLIYRSPLLPWTGAVPVSTSISAAWIAAAVYALLTSTWDRVVLRRALGVALLAPALAYSVYHAGLPFAAPAPWLAVLALATLVVASLVENRERKPELFYGALTGAGVMLAHGTFLAVWQWLQGKPFLAPALAFGLLALAVVALAARLRAYWNSDLRGAEPGTARGILTTTETLALLLLAMVGVCVAGHRGILVPYGPFVLAGIAALIAVVALVGEALSTLFVRAVVSAPGAATSAAAESLRAQRPFYTARAIVALLFSGLAYYELLVNTPALSKTLAITGPWVAALVPLLIALRGSLDISLVRRTERSLEKRAPDAVVLVAALLAALLAITTVVRALHAGFWEPATLPAVRNSCALFFGVLLAISLFCGAGLKRTFAPVTGMVALLGLAGCAYGAFDKLPDQSFGVCCALLAWLAALLLTMARKADSFRTTRVPGALSFSAAAVALLGAVFLVVGLVEWQAGATQSWGVLGWFLLAALAWRASARSAPAWCALVAGLGTTAAVLHALRWAAQDFTQFGPGLATAALLMLALREVVAYVDAPPSEETDERPTTASSPLQGRSGGVIAAAFVTACLSLVFGAWGGFARHEWLCCITLTENALLLTALSVLLRRHACATARQHFLLEMSAWLLLALAVVVAVSPGAAAFPLSATGWILVSALFLLIGMAGESTVSALTGTPARLETAARGVPFLGSRHCAAFVICALGLLAALVQPHAFAQGAAQLQETWRAILGAAALAIYASMARSSANEQRTQTVRGIASFLAYVVLLPGGYLCFLHAHSTGSPCGAMYLLALAPLLLIAAYVLEREKLRMQASQALLGVGLVSVGALLLAFLTGKQLAVVPAATLAALSAEMLLLRAWRPLRDDETWRTAERQYSLGACLAFIGAAFYGLRALNGWQAWGDPRGLWAWELPAMTALGLALTALGGACKLERNDRSHSLVAGCGAWLSALAPAVALVELTVYGSCARYLQFHGNTDRLDAVIVCFLLFAAMSLAAKRWLDFAAARYVAPAALMAAYAMYMWKLQPGAWEWYTVPAAAFLYVWAWETARSTAFQAVDARQEQETTALLMLASIMALGPSFIQALSDTREGTYHFLALLGLGLAILFGAMLSRRKVPLLAGAGAMVLSTLIKAVEWAHHKDVLWPLIGIIFGFLVLGVGMLFESRMNQAFRKAVDRAKAEARMFWVSWR